MNRSFRRKKKRLFKKKGLSNEKVLSTDWVFKTPEMLPVIGMTYSEKESKLEELAKFVDKETDGAIEARGHTLVQKKKLPWSYVYDVAKNLYEAYRGSIYKLHFDALCKWPADFVQTGSVLTERDVMKAKYLYDKNGVELSIHSGRKIENRGGYDGFGMERDDIEMLGGVRGREGNWIEPLHLYWEE